MVKLLRTILFGKERAAEPSVTLFALSEASVVSGEPTGWICLDVTNSITSEMSGRMRGNPRPITVEWMAILPWKTARDLTDEWLEHIPQSQRTPTGWHRGDHQRLVQFMTDRIDELQLRPQTPAL